MSKKIYITGASQRVQQNGKGEWEAWYECHKCGDEFASSSDYCRDEKTAREESDIGFDKQQRRYCWRCGYKLTTLDPIPENELISSLNSRIGDLLKDRKALVRRKQELMQRIKMLEDTPNNTKNTEQTNDRDCCAKQSPDISMENTVRQNLFNRFITWTRKPQ